MERLKIKIHPLFIIYVFICIYFNWINLIFYYIVVMFLHEFAHYFVAKQLGYSVNGMLLSIYGLGLQTNNAYKRRDEILISVAGPIMNVILIVLTVFFWWISPSLYFFTYDFVVCNMLIMLFNLIPLYPLDGGRVMVCMFPEKLKYKVIKVSNIISLILGILLVVLFFVSVFLKINLNLLFIGLFMIINSISFDRNMYFNTISTLNKCNNKPIEIKRFVINDYDKSKLIKHLSPHYYSIFECHVDGEIIVIHEEDLLK